MNTEYTKTGSPAVSFTHAAKTEQSAKCWPEDAYLFLLHNLEFLLWKQFNLMFGCFKDCSKTFYREQIQESGNHLQL